MQQHNLKQKIKNKLQEKGSALIYFAVFILTVVVLFVIVLFSYVHRQVTQARDQWQTSQSTLSVKSGLAFALAYVNETDDQDDYPNMESLTNAFESGETQVTVTSDDWDHEAFSQNGGTYIVTFSPLPDQTFPEMDQKGAFQAKITGCPITISVDDCQPEARYASTISVKLIKYFEAAELTPSIDVPLASRGDISLEGNPSVSNHYGDYAIAKTSFARVNTRGNPSVTAGNPYPENIQSISDWDSLDARSFFYNIFNVSYDALVDGAKVVTDQRELESAASDDEQVFYSPNSMSITGNTVVGSSDHPVLLLIDGSYEQEQTASGTPIFWGYVFSTGNFDLRGNVEVHGGIFSAADMQTNTSSPIEGNVNISYKRYDNIDIDDIEGVGGEMFVYPAPSSLKRY